MKFLSLVESQGSRGITNGRVFAGFAGVGLGVLKEFQRQFGLIWVFPHGVQRAE